MKVAFDISALRHGVRGGVAVYTRALAAALLEREEVEDVVLLFCAREGPEAATVLRDLEARGGRIVRGPAPWRWFPDGGWWLPVEPRLGRLLAEVDVFHAGEFLVPRAAPVPVVATIQDLTTVLFPEHHIPWNRWRDRRRLRWVRERADRIVVPSHSTAIDVAERMGIGPGRVDVVPLAAGNDARDGQPYAVVEGGKVGGESTDPRTPTFAPTRERPPSPDEIRILFVGTLEPRKNVERLVRAFERVAPRHPEARLVLVGPEGWRGGPLARLLDESGVRERIELTGFLPAAELRARYEEADVFAYPSLYEGFGLPVLEAMEAGTAVLTSNVSSIPEVAGDAAVLVDPRSVGEVASGLDRLLSDPSLRRDLARRGRERARRFTWEATAGATVESYRRAIEGRRSP